MRKGHSKSMKGLDLVEEGYRTLRSLPVSALTLYYTGTLPFVLALLTFWTDMSRNAYAYGRIGMESLLLAAVFIWMKCWHCAFTDRVMEAVTGGTVRSRKKMKITGLIGHQSLIHSTGLFVLPAALFLMFPFAHVYAFYQNATVFGRDSGSVKELYRRSKKQAMLRPGQNNIVMWLTSPYLLILTAAVYLIILPLSASAAPVWTENIMLIVAGLMGLLLIPLSPLCTITALNFAFLILTLPFLLKTLAGIETVFSRGGYEITNTTFIAVIFALTYLVVDPLAKTCYVLRCFYGESLSTGRDLKVGLSKIKAAALLMIIMPVLFAFPAAAKDRRTALSPDELDARLERTIRRREYTWRMPRERLEVEEKDKGPVYLFFEGIAETVVSWGKTVKGWVRKFGEWLENTMPDPGVRESKGTMGGSALFLRVLLYLAVALLISVIAVLVYRVWKFRPGRIKSEASASRSPDVSDVEREETAPDDFAGEEWLALARELAEKKEYRLAVRALFLAGLACLGEKEMITIARFKSNRDYERELMKRRGTVPGLLPEFRKSSHLYEKTWYGRYPASEELFEDITEYQRRIRTIVT